MIRMKEILAGFCSRRMNRRRRVRSVSALCDTLEFRITPTTSIVSAGLTGITAAGASSSPSISADNRYVVFASTADNLVADDRNSVQDVFLRDLQTGITTRMSKSTAGGDADLASGDPRISADGNWVAFESYATNIVPDDESYGSEIFLYHRPTGSLSRAIPAGFPGEEYQAANPDISGDGRYVVFESQSSTLVAGDTNGYHDIFRVDRQTGTIQRVSVDSAENEGNGWSYRPTISNNGRYVAFQSGSEFTVTDPGSHTNIFVRDIVSGTTTLASVNSSEVPGDSDSFNASISSDGTSVVFMSLANNLAAVTNYGGYPIYLRNLLTGTTTLVSVLPSNVTADGWASDTFAPSISDDKRYVTFQAYAINQEPVNYGQVLYSVYRRDLQSLTTTVLPPGNRTDLDSIKDVQISPDGTRTIFASTDPTLVSDDRNNQSDVLLLNHETNLYSAVSLNGTGLVSVTGNRDSRLQAITPDARYVLFISEATNLGVIPATQVSHLYRKDRQTGVVTLVSVNTSGQAANANVESAAMSADGRYIVFDTAATNLADDEDNETDIFLRDILLNTTTRISIGRSGADASGSSSRPSISGDGRYVVFESNADNLILGDTNSAADIFLLDRSNGVKARVSVSATGAELPSASSLGRISQDGSTISFATSESLVPADTYSGIDVYIRSRSNPSTVNGINLSSSGEWGDDGSYYSAMSSTGRYVLFESDANSLTSDEFGSRNDVYLRDRLAGTTVRVSLTSGGDAADHNSYIGGISVDGRFATFSSAASNLIDGDTNQQADIFVRDMLTSTNYRVSMSSGGLESDHESRNPLISSNGLSIVFDSKATNLVAGDFGAYVDVYSTVLQLAPTNLSLSNATTHEKAPLNTVIGTFETEDLNSPESFTYSLVSGTGASGNSAFTIVEDELRLNSALNFEVKSTYLIRVRVTDAAGLTYEKNFTIAITNRNEPPTNITLSSNSINENAAALTTIGTFTTADPDAGPPHVYSLVDGTGDTDNGAFSILGNKIRARSSFNFEEKSLYSVRIRTRDSGNLFLEKVFSIRVNDVNESPTGISLSGNSLPENAAATARVGVFSTVDPDGGDSHSYSLVSGPGSTDNGSFTIAGKELRAAKTFDFETKKSYAVRVRSTDADGLFVNEEFTITISNVNDAPTNISISNSLIQENKPAGSLVGVLTTTDQDPGSLFSYFLVAGAGSTHNSLFRIAGDDLLTTAPFNFEETPQLSIRVRTRDSGGLTYDEVLTVTAVNVNESPISLRLDRLSVDENLPIRSEVGRLITTDPDANSSFVWYVTPFGTSDDYKYFVIEGNRLLTRATFDHEAKSIYRFRIVCRDQGGLSVESTFSIGINDTNDAPTEMELSGVTIAEGTGAGRLIGSLTGRDPDAGSTLTWSLPAGQFDNSKFRIVGNQIRTSAALDFETDPSHTIIVQARDNGSLTLWQAWTIVVTDVSENVLFGMDNVTVPENAPEDFVVATFLPTFTYSLVPGIGDNTFFRISGNRLLVAVNLDHEARNLRTLKINVSPKKGVVIPVYYLVSVMNVNEAPTIQFANLPTQYFTIRRNSSFAANSLITVGDPDPGANKGEMTVTVQTSQGTLKVGDRLDVDMQGNGTYKVTIRGEQAAINASLRGLVVSPNGAVGSVNVAITVYDRGNSGNRFDKERKIWPGTIGLSTSRNFTINVVNSIPLPPFASSLSFTLNSGINSLQVTEADGLIRNRTDADGDDLTVKLVTAPASYSGILKLSANGSFTFTRSNNFRGIVTFSVRYNDGLADSAIASVTLRLL